MTDKQYLAGKTGEELKDLVAQYGMPRFAASQIAAWLYRNRVRNIDQMTNLSKINREKLSADFEIGYTEPVEANRSEDGTVKYLFAAGESFIETVYIPDRERATLCVSSQVGCKMNCLFCMTGKQGFKKNLTATEIINQIVSVPEFEKLTNIVFMGMGEPLDNTDEVLKALDILTSERGFAWSPRRITLSTIGITPNLRRFLDESQCHLAVSLHHPFAEGRQELMPIQKHFPYPKRSNCYDSTISATSAVSLSNTSFSKVSTTLLRTSTNWHICCMASTAVSISYDSMPYRK